MQFSRFALAAAALVAVVAAALSSNAEARSRGVAVMAMPLDVAAVPAYPTAEMPGRAGHRAGSPAVKQLRTGRGSLGEAMAAVEPSYGEGVIGGRPSACNIRIGGRLIPFCGCAVSLKVFGEPVRELFLAANWRKFPRAAAAAGRVAWRWGHVILIEETHDDGTVTAYDPNSGGGMTRRHRVSLRGYKVVDPRGGQIAGLNPHRL